MADVTPNPGVDAQIEDLKMAPGSLSIESHAHRRVGLFGAVVMLVGFVIGASIYVLPGELFAIAGPAFIVSFALAALPAACSCLIAAQIGAAYPVDAANIVMVRQQLSPFWAALSAWCFVGACVVALALLAYGFADYAIAALSLDSSYRLMISLCTIAFFTLINLFGASIAASIQLVMVLGLVLILALFVIFGVPALSPERFHPFAPQGTGAIALAAVPAFFAFLGFSLIVEISGEVKSPQRTVPLALAIGFALILGLYLAVSAIVVGTLPADMLENSGSVVATAAAQFAPAWLVTSITLSALLAAATSINAVILFASRDLAACAGILRGHQAPHEDISARARSVAVATIGVVGALCVFTGSELATYATITVVGILVAQAIISLAAMKIPGALGDDYARLAFRIPRSLLVLACAAMIASALIFIVLSLLGSFVPVTACGLFIGIGCAVYGLSRVRIPGRGKPD